MSRGSELVAEIKQQAEQLRAARYTIEAVYLSERAEDALKELLADGSGRLWRAAPDSIIGIPIDKTKRPAFGSFAFTTRR